jgi:hypothetical protein
VGLSAKIVSAAAIVRRSPFAATLGVILCIVYLYFFAYRALVEIELKIDSPYPGYFKIYWAEGDQAYTEKNARRVLITGTRQNYSMFLTNLANVSRLRIDPIEYQGTARLGRLSISQSGYDPVIFDSADELARIKPVQQIHSMRIVDNVLVLETSGEDGQLELAIDPPQASGFPFVHLVNLVLIFVAVLLLSRALGFLFRDDLYVPCSLLVVLILAAIMASLTGLDVHPDEQAHLKAVDYYSKHFLPPAIDSPAAENSFSVYGYSRLYNLELYYQVAGYFGRILSPLRLPAALDSRLFGLFLLAALTIASIKVTGFRVFVLPVLISAQTWYLFSYSNSEGFALFIAVVMSYQVACKESLFNRILSEPTPRHLWLYTAMFGVMAGVLLLLKTNFYFFILFLGMYLIWRIARGDFPNQKQLWQRLIIISIVGATVYGARIGLDIVVNGFDRQAKTEEMAELRAQPLYKPSTPLNEKHLYLYMRDRGVSLDRMIIKDMWGGKSFITAFGAYGFTQYFASPTFYELVRIIGFAILGLMLLGTLIHGPPSTHVLLMMIGICCSLLTVMLLWRSWTISFQPQGRYFAPILPMLGIMYYHIRPYVYDKVVAGLSVCLFLLGVYSFIFIGLLEIGKSTASVW